MHIRNRGTTRVGRQRLLPPETGTVTSRSSGQAEGNSRATPRIGESRRAGRPRPPSPTTPPWLRQIQRPEQAGDHPRRASPEPRGRAGRRRWLRSRGPVPSPSRPAVRPTLVVTSGPRSPSAFATTPAVRSPARAEERAAALTFPRRSAARRSRPPLPVARFPGLRTFVFIGEKVWPYQDIGLPALNKVGYVRAVSPGRTA